MYTKLLFYTQKVLRLTGHVQKCTRVSIALVIGPRFLWLEFNVQLQLSGINRTEY